MFISSFFALSLYVSHRKPSGTSAAGVIQNPKPSTLAFIKYVPGNRELVVQSEDSNNSLLPGEPSSAWQLMQMLRRADLDLTPKGEFETTEAYKARVKDEFAKGLSTFVGPYRTNDYFLISAISMHALKESEGGFIRWEYSDTPFGGYNPDTQKLTMFFDVPYGVSLGSQYFGKGGDLILGKNGVDYVKCDISHVPHFFKSSLGTKGHCVVPHWEETVQIPLSVEEARQKSTQEGGNYYYPIYLICRLDFSGDPLLKGNASDTNFITGTPRVAIDGVLVLNSVARNGKWQIVLEKLESSTKR